MRVGSAPINSYLLHSFESQIYRVSKFGDNVKTAASGHEMDDKVKFEGEERGFYERTITAERERRPVGSDGWVGDWAAWAACL